MANFLRARWLASLAVVTIVVAAVLVATLGDEEDEKPSPKAPASSLLRVDGSDPDRHPDDPLTVPAIDAPAVSITERDAGGEVGPAHGDNQRDETPPDSPLAAPGVEAKDSANPEARDAFRDSQREAKRGTTGSDAPLPAGPLATRSTPGCRTAFVPNRSSRRGARIGAIALHYTAGPNRAGLADMLGLTSFANNPRSQVSWHYLWDREGHCFYSVPLEEKAWTIAALNPFTVNGEMVGLGSEPDYGGAGFARMADTVRYVAKLYGIPLRVGAVSNCRVTRTGIVTHWMGGSCSGGHHDIRPFDVIAIVRRIAQGEPRPVPARYQRRCNELRKLRKSADRRRRQKKSPLLTRGQHSRRTKLRRSFEPPESRKAACDERTGKAVRS